MDRYLAKEPTAPLSQRREFAEAIDQALRAREGKFPRRCACGSGRVKQDRPARVVLVGVAVWAGLVMTMLTQNTWIYFAPIVFATAVGVVPAFLRLRRVLRDGYITDDLAAALREHQLVRSEEMAYELSQRSPLAHRVARIALAASAATTALLAGLMAAQPQARSSQDDHH